MLDHDELLSAEQAHPDLVQELRTLYQMKPEEQRVLARVHQRLAENSHPLPVRETTQAANPAQPRRPVAAISSRARPSRQRWLRPLSTFAAVLFVGLLVGALVLTFSINRNRSSIGSSVNGLSVFLVPAQKGSTPSQTELEAASTILAHRFSAFGLHGFSVSVQTATSNGQSGILVELPHFGGNEQQTIDTLVGTGKLAFWGTGQTPVLAGATFDPSQFTQENPGGQPRFTNQDLDPNSFAVTTDPNTGQPLIEGMIKGNADQRFQRYTTQNVGNYLTVTLDGKVLQSAVINSAFSGPFVISGQFTQQQASSIVAVLSSGPLPVELIQQT